MWTENFQMFKLELGKAEEPEIKLPISVGSQKKQRNFRKTFTSASLTTLTPLTVCITKNCGKFLKEMGIPDHLTCLLRNLYVGQEATVRTGHTPRDWFKIGKGIRYGCILSPCLFNLYAEYIMRNARLDESQAGIKTARRNMNNKICRWYHSNGRKWRGTKGPLDESEKGEWKSWLKTQHSKKIMASGPITSWQIDGGKVETVTDFIFLGSKITADGDCSHEIKRCLLPGRKGMSNLDSILKSRDIFCQLRSI